MVAPKRQLYEPPMQANKIDIDNIERKASDFVMEPKLDGWRCLTYVEGGNVTMLSRTGKPFHDKVPLIVAELQHLPDCVLDGELGFISKPYWDGWPIFDYPSTASTLGSGVDEALRKQDEYGQRLGGMQYHLFDLPSESGRPWEDRHASLADLFTDHIGPGFVQLLEPHAAWSEELYELYVFQGGEGVMLKNPRGLYMHGKRPANNWWKVKKFETETVRIDGFKGGEGKYSHTLGALHWTATDGTQGWCSGMTDQERDNFWEHQEYFRYSKMDIRHFGRVGKDQEGVRHPQFIKMRPDLDT